MAPYTTLFSLLLCAVSLALNVQCAPPFQKVLGDGSSGNVVKVRDELRKAEIIPTVINDFIPTFALNVSWSKKQEAQLGNTLKPKKLQHAPSITLYSPPEAPPHSTLCKSGITFAFALTDPDAPSRDNPEWSEMCHWIATGVSLTRSPSEESCELAITGTLEDIVDYKPPGPPPKTGKHRYVFLVLAPANGTDVPLNLTTPSDRQHWGTGKERHGVRDWATTNGLVPVAANFIYAQNKKQ